MLKINKIITIFILCFSVLFIVCTEISANSNNFIDNENTYFGYGYDITSGKSLSDAAGYKMQNPILDIDSKLYSNIKDISNNSTANVSNIVADSAQSFAEQYSSKFSSNFNFQINATNINVNSMFAGLNVTNNSASERFEMYFQDITVGTKVLQMELDEIQKKLSSKFISDIKSINNIDDAKSIIEKYGTHLMTGFTYGGRLEIMNYQQTTSTTKDLYENNSLEAKINTAINKNSVGSLFSFNDSFELTENNSIQNSYYTFRSLGGEALSALSIDDLFTYHTSLTGGGYFEIDKWSASINNKENLGVIGIPSYKTYSIYELLPTTSEFSLARSLLLSAYTIACADRYTEFANEYPTLPNASTGFITPEYMNVYGIYEENDQNIKYTKSTDLDYVEIDSTIYLDTYDTIAFEKKEWKTKSPYVTIIDSRNGIFKLNGFYNTNFTLDLYSNDELMYTKTLYFKSEKYSGGSGSSDNPFKLSSVSDLNSLKWNVDDYSMHFELTNDINCEGINLTPIGTKLAPFSGSINGKGCSIYNFNLIEQNVESFGLFSYNSGTISNLKVGKVDYNTTLSLSISNSSDTNFSIGALVGVNTGIISDCTVNYANIFLSSSLSTSHDVNIGGLAGRSDGYLSEISSCMINDLIIESDITADVSKNVVTSNVGGLAGYISYANIKNCIVFDIVEISSVFNVKKSNVTVNSNVGGLVGIADFSIIETCISIYDNSTIFSVINENNNKPTISTFKSNFFGVLNESYCFNLFYQVNTIVEESIDGITSKNVVSYENLEEYLSSDIWMNGGESTICLISQSTSIYSIEVDDELLKVSFYLGETFTINKNAFKVIDGNGAEIDFTYFNYDTNIIDNKLGKFEANVYIFGVKYSYTVYIREVEIKSIVLSQNTNVNTYTNSDLQLDSLNTQFILENGDLVTLDDLNNYPGVNYPVSTFKATLINSTKLIFGLNKVVVSYSNFESIIFISAIENQPIELYVSYQNEETIYNANKEYILDNNVKFTVRYKDGFEEELNNSDVDLLITILANGENKITVSYKGHIFCDYYINAEGVIEKNSNVILIVSICSGIIIAFGIGIGVKRKR